MLLLGSIEFRDEDVTCAVGDGHVKIIDKVEFPLTDPKTTLGNVIRYFQKFDDVKAIVVSSFGPLELRNYSSKYGYILDSSRPQWSNVNLLGTLKQYLKVPISFTTDVNSTAYGEYITSVLANHPVLSLVYITISKGVGAGIVNDGELIGYQGSPEIGHIYPERHPDDQTFKGTCPYQGDCLEGLVAEPAFEARFGKSYKEISMFEPIWDIVAYYIAQSAIQATLLMRPQKIILGGDIVNEVELQKIKQQFQKLLNNYVDVGPIDDYLVAPSNSSRKLSIVGNLSLAKKEFYSASDVTIE